MSEINDSSSIQRTNPTIPNNKELSESSSPYILHPSDNPGTVFVSHLLKEDNYQTWKRAMTNALQDKNKIGFVDGSIPRPAADSPRLDAWVKTNSMVVSWIFNSLHSSLHDSVAYFDTAREIWVDLEERLSQGNAPRVHQLKAEIVNTQQGDMSIAAYYTKLKGYWDEYNAYSQIPPCTCGAAKAMAVEKEKEKLHQFLMGLNEKFNVVRSQILNMEPLPTLARSYALATQEEKQQQVENWRGTMAGTEAAAFIAVQRRSKNNGHRNHNISQLFCDHCKKSKHTKETCFELYGYPEWWEKSKSKTPREKAAN